MDLLKAHIGIDPSYSAFAMILFTEHPQDPENDDFGEYLFDFSRTKSRHGGGRLQYIERTLRDHLDVIRRAFDVRTVVMEGYAPGSKFNREAMGELGGVTKLVLADLFGDDPLHIVAPTALKKFVTGSGNAAKDNMLLQTYKKWGVEFKSNDLADAYGLAQIGRAITHGSDLKYEREVIDAIMKGREK